MRQRCQVAVRLVHRGAAVAAHPRPMCSRASLLLGKADLSYLPPPPPTFPALTTLISLISPRHLPLSLPVPYESAVSNRLTPFDTA